MGQVRVSRHNQRGQTKVIDIEVRDREGDLMDPDTLTAEVLDPDTATSPTTYTFGVDGVWGNPSVGVYTFDLTPDTASDAWPWEARFIATTDDDVAVAQVKLWVEQDRFEEA